MEENTSPKKSKVNDILKYVLVILAALVSIYLVYRLFIVDPRLNEAIDHLDSAKMRLDSALHEIDTTKSRINILKNDIQFYTEKINDIDSGVMQLDIKSKRRDVNFNIDRDKLLRARDSLFKVLKQEIKELPPVTVKYNDKK